LKDILKVGIASNEEISAAVSSWLGKALIKCFADDSERARAHALNIFHDQMCSHPDALLPMLPYVMPVLEERLVKKEGCEVPEACEEVRLQLIDVRPHSIAVVHGSCHQNLTSSLQISLLNHCM
jgi:hypothetical protein